MKHYNCGWCRDVGITMGGDLALFMCSCKVADVIWRHMSPVMRARTNDLLPVELLKERAGEKATYLKGQMGIDEIIETAMREHPDTFLKELTEAKRVS